VTGLDAVRHRSRRLTGRNSNRCANRDVLFHCFNPDRVVVRGGVPEPCAGALADVYEGMGGRCEWYGKPHHGIYEYA
jgi:ribonucleotide monophosphatase NagD (HAD superfamily)